MQGPPAETSPIFRAPASSFFQGAERCESDAAERFPRLSAADRLGRKIRVNILSETSRFGLTAQGGHTAFLDCVELMRSHPDLEIHVNSQVPCDVLHSHSWGPFYVAAGLSYRGRRIFTAHALPETAEGALPGMGRLTRAMVRAYLKSIYDYSDVLVAVSPASADSLRALGVLRPIEILPNPIRDDRFFPSPALRTEGRALLGSDGGRPLVLGVGQLQPRKGIADFARVAESLPEADFVWVGGRPFGLVSAGIRDLRKLMSSPPSNLRFAGTIPLERMPVVYNASDLLLFPSFQENCPYVPMEAAACGVPVIFRDLPSYRRLYATEFLAASDVPTFVRLARQVLASRARRAIWSRASQRLAARFRPARFIEALSQIYDEVALRECRRPHR